MKTATTAALLAVALCTGGGLEARADVAATGQIVVQAEHGTGAGRVFPRSRALGDATVLLQAGASRRLTFRARAARYAVAVRYSNDSGTADDPGRPERVRIRVGGRNAWTFAAANTRQPGATPGSGWNVFRVTPSLGTVALAAGRHTVAIAVSGGDGYGVELDAVILRRR